MNEEIFITDPSEVRVGFSRDSFKQHQGISGLRYYPLVMFMRKHLQTLGEISFSLNTLLDECGYSSKSRNNIIREDFALLIKNEILDKNHATCDCNILEAKPSKIITLQLKDSAIFFADDQFVLFSISEFTKITSIISNVNSSILVGVYLYVKQFIPVENGLNQNYHKLAYPSKQKMQQTLGIQTVSTIEKALEILVEYKLLYVEKNLYVEDTKREDIYIPARNVYALDPKQLENDAALMTLETVYGRPVYRKPDIPGKIGYLTK